MQPPHRHHRTSRRGFFKRAAFLGTAAVSACLGVRPSAAKKGPPVNSRTQARYRLTAHIRNYYRRAAL